MNIFFIISLCTLMHSISNCIAEYKYYRIINSKTCQSQITNIIALQNALATYQLIHAAQEGNRTFRVTIWQDDFVPSKSIYPLHDLTLQCTDNEAEPSKSGTLKFNLDNKTITLLLALQASPKFCNALKHTQ
jgi:hypothetical protein